MARFSVTLESNDHGTTEPVDAVTIEAESEREAERAAARAWGLRPHQWCFEHSPYIIQAVEMED